MQHESQVEIIRRILTHLRERTTDTSAEQADAEASTKQG